MAITSIGNRGTGVAGATASTTATMAPTATVAVGRILLVSVVSPSTGTHDSVTDTSGNTYELLAESTGNSQTVSLWRTRVGVQLTTGSTITATFGSSIADKALGAWEFSVGSGNTLNAVSASTQTNTSTGSGFGSLTTSGMSSVEHLHWRVCGKNANSTTALTPTSSWTNTTWAIRSRNNTAARILRAEFRITTSAGETSNPTFAVTGNYATALVPLVEETAPGAALVGAATGTLTATGTLPVPVNNAFRLNEQADSLQMASRTGRFPVTMLGWFTPRAQTNPYMGLMSLEEGPGHSTSYNEVGIEGGQFSVYDDIGGNLFLGGTATNGTKYKVAFVVESGTFKLYVGQEGTPGVTLIASGAMNNLPVRPRARSPWPTSRCRVRPQARLRPQARSPPPSPWSARAWARASRPARSRRPSRWRARAPAPDSPRELSRRPFASRARRQAAVLPRAS